MVLLRRKRLALAVGSCGWAWGWDDLRRCERVFGLWVVVLRVSAWLLWLEGMDSVGGGEGDWRGEVGRVGGVGRAVVGVSCEDGGVVGRVYGVGTVVFGPERKVLRVMELGGVCGSVGTMAAVSRVRPDGRSRSNSRRWNCRRF